MQKRFSFIVVLILSWVALYASEDTVDIFKGFGVNFDAGRLASSQMGGEFIQLGVTKDSKLPYVRYSLDYYHLIRKDYYYMPDFHVFDLSCQARTLSRFYVHGGLVAHFAAINGYVAKYDSEGIPGDIDEFISKRAYRPGVGLSVGTGIKISDRLYMENSIKIGTFLFGMNYKFYCPYNGGFFELSDQDGPIFFSVDLLKFGYRFGDSIALPITGKAAFEKDHFSIAINPLRLFTLSEQLKIFDNLSKSFSASTSYFFHKSDLELGLHYFYRDHLKPSENYEGINTDQYVGVNLRKYFTDTRVKTYLCINARNLILTGMQRDEEDDDVYHSVTAEKIGAGFGGGFKYFLNKKLFLDFYAIVGRYFTDDIVFEWCDSSYLDIPVYWEIGSFKLGYCF